MGGCGRNPGEPELRVACRVSPPPSSVIKVQNLEQPGVVLRGKERLQAIAGLIKKAKYAGQGVDTLILLLSLEKEP